MASRRSSNYFHLGNEPQKSLRRRFYDRFGATPRILKDHPVYYPGRSTLVRRGYRPTLPTIHEPVHGVGAGVYRPSTRYNPTLPWMGEDNFGEWRNLMSPYRDFGFRRYDLIPIEDDTDYYDSEYDDDDYFGMDDIFDSPGASDRSPSPRRYSPIREERPVLPTTLYNSPEYVDDDYFGMDDIFGTPGSPIPRRYSPIREERPVLPTRLDRSPSVGAPDGYYAVETPRRRLSF